MTLCAIAVNTATSIANPLNGNVGWTGMKLSLFGYYFIMAIYRRDTYRATDWMAQFCKMYVAKASVV